MYEVMEVVVVGEMSLYKKVPGVMGGMGAVDLEADNRIRNYD